jgi:hypothetical protein
MGHLASPYVSSFLNEQPFTKRVSMGSPHCSWEQPIHTSSQHRSDSEL